MKNLRLTLVFVASIALSLPLFAVEVIDGMLERIDPGLSRKIKVEIVPDSVDRFELSQQGVYPVVRANNPVSAAVGINWYLKHCAGVHLSWNSMTAAMPDTLPAVKEPVVRTTDLKMRYYLNYCTHSYSMAFWNRERWDREIDWMALHGINMPLAITGTDVLWRNVMRRLGYSDDKINEFVAGPGFQAWWLMNNLEGWGGPNPESHYRFQEDLGRHIIGRMREFGMEPVLPGYSGMMPHDARETLGLDVADGGMWLGFKRPSFLQPADSAFSRIAAIYYDEQQKLFGTAKYYSMDPFHEGGRTEGVDLAAAGRAIMKEMKAVRPDAVWVIQAWRANPRREMIEALDKGDLVVLDLHAETEPIWNTREGGFSGHDWLYCMLHNFGGNIGLYGRIPSMAADFPVARADRDMLGTGLTMEGIETNPVVYEFMGELPWLDAPVDAEAWTRDYVRARYGGSCEALDSTWHLLLNSVYACPPDSRQQGTLESLFCARPSDNPRQASAWAQNKPYYNYGDVAEAARLMLSADGFAGNPNYIYDLVDVTRQAVADRGREELAATYAALQNGDKEAYRAAADRFLALIDMQDELLGTITDFRLGRWLRQAGDCADTQAEKERYRWNARCLITVWGTRRASNKGKLHDYAHREWQGLLKDFYRPRWERWFDARLADWGGKAPDIDFFAIEEAWTLDDRPYSEVPEGDPIATAAKALRLLERK